MRSRTLKPRTGLFGYRRLDVDALIAGHEEQLRTLANSLEEVWTDRARIQNELHETRTRLQAELEHERALRVAAEQRGRAEAARIVAEAQEQAAAIRTEASQRVADASDRLGDVLRVRDQLLGEVRGILSAYGDVLERAEGRVPAVAPPTLRAAEDVVAHAVRRPVALPLDAQQPETLFPRLVRVDAGPFSDFSELSAFERSLAGLPKVEDVYIRTFGDDRAEIDLTLAEERPLVHDLDRHLPYRFTATADDDGKRLTVELAAAG